MGSTDQSFEGHNLVTPGIHDGLEGEAEFKIHAGGSAQVVRMARLGGRNQ